MTLPEALRKDLQRNFVAGEPPNNATDQAPNGGLSNRGHGTGTLSILAGNRLDGTVQGFLGFADYLGGAPGSRSSPCASPTGSCASGSAR